MSYDTGFYYGDVLDTHRLYHPYGAVEKLMYCKDPIVLVEGPAGTGKSRGVLEKGFILMDKYPGCRIGLFRNTRKSLTQTSMVTFEQKVMPPGALHFSTVDQEYRHPNGSIMAVGGLDKPSKIMSSEYDVIIVPEATEITRDAAESLTTRLRNGKIPYQQLILDCNPAGPLHWLNMECKDKSGNRMGITRLRSKHKDNPLLWDHAAGTWTKLGREYMLKLRNLSGVRFFRYFKGVWRQAEGMVYEDWDDAKHHINRFEPPAYWPRYWVVDFGFKAPFTWQEWVMDPDGRLYLYNEIYMTERIIADHCKDILRITNNIAIRPRAVICDHDAEGRATMERELRIKTTLAWKENKLESIEAVKRRLRPAGDGLQRLFVMRDSLHEIDRKLEEEKLPKSAAEEPEGYIWEEDARKERPVDKDDHAMNCFEYLVAHVDKLKAKSKGGGKVVQSTYAGQDMD